jgi:hypothetical protein
LLSAHAFEQLAGLPEDRVHLVAANGTLLQVAQEEFGLGLGQRPLGTNVQLEG